LGEEEVNKRLAHKKVKTDLEELKLNLKKAEDNSAAIKSRYAKRELSEEEANSSLKENTERINGLRDSVKAKEVEYSDSLLNNFGEYVSKKSKEDSDEKSIVSSFIFLMYSFSLIGINFLRRIKIIPETSVFSINILFLTKKPLYPTE
jgi:hypothetical protein